MRQPKHVRQTKQYYEQDITKLTLERWAGSTTEERARPSQSRKEKATISTTWAGPPLSLVVVHQQRHLRHAAGSISRR